MKHLWKKLVGISLIVVAVFVFGLLGYQRMVEKAFANNETIEIQKENDSNYQPADEKTLTVFYENELAFDARIITDLTQKYQLDKNQTTVGELTKEQFDYLQASYYLHSEAEAPILAKNEKPSTAEDFTYSLESMEGDVMAMGEEDDSEAPILAILEKYQVDPEGKIKDLNVEIIMEISAALFQASSHPKE
ncbi:hypothetical protein [Enterococcus sp. AZ163]|uniref:hypothetical protein n=1 Tax=Enterococcus sp. AZ163 TaxID=2774638 RepID=UPI003D2A1A10